MENIGYIALSGQMALNAQMNTVANNIANANTVGYQSQHMVFEQYLSEEDPDNPITMVNDYGQYRNILAGPIQITGNSMDFSLNGNGYFAIRDFDGVERYTRNGNFQLNHDRIIVDSSGRPVMDTGGKEITIPNDVAVINVDSQGQISRPDGSVIGQLKIVTVENPNSMRNFGNNLLEATDGVLEDQETQVVQGTLEQSNVNPILEMTEMITVLRKYQSVARLLQTDHDRQRNSISTLSRLR